MKCIKCRISIFKNGLIFVQIYEVYEPFHQYLILISTVWRLSKSIQRKCMAKRVMSIPVIWFVHSRCISSKEKWMTCMHQVLFISWDSRVFTWDQSRLAQVQGRSSHRHWMMYGGFVWVSTAAVCLWATACFYP